MVNDRRFFQHGPPDQAGCDAMGSAPDGQVFSVPSVLSFDLLGKRWCFDMAAGGMQDREANVRSNHARGHLRRARLSQRASIVMAWVANFRHEKRSIRIEIPRAFGPGFSRHTSSVPLAVAFGL